jgi:hypothetical protein
MLTIAEDSVSYVVEHDKVGRYLLPGHFVGVTGQRIYIGRASYPLKLRLDASRPPRSIELMGDRQSFEFDRQTRSDAPG